MGVQLHPEVPPQIMEDWVWVYQHELDAEGVDPDVLLEKTHESAAAAAARPRGAARCVPEVGSEAARTPPMVMAPHPAARIRRPSVEFSPIRQPRAHDYVAEQIRRHIALRLIAPGEALPPGRELAAMFGVGRPTVQHALRMLEGEHLVEARRGRSGGTFVLHPTEDSRVMEELITRLLRRRHELLELLDHRRVLEPAIANLAARSRRGDDLHRMRRALDGMASAPPEPDYMYFDTEFHIAVADATRNRFLSQAIEQIRMDLNDALSLLPESEVWHRQLAGEHEAIFAAIEARDPSAAEATAARHVANSDTGVRAVLTAIRRSMARGAGR